ncbi:MAG: CxxxxCH/CxxCH domain-containing protein [Proteobacteria bacterium]|nr:CxxxxCH/CxxCH domain-containing protein [Pseudomonadota bacterium]
MSIDAPHNISNGIDCESCHGVTILSSGYWHLDAPLPEDIGNNDRTLYNLICMSCHNKKSGPFNEVEGPLVVTHSGRETESAYHDPDNPWTRQCIDCHNPHIQEQKNWNSVDDLAQLKLASGKIVGFFYDRITDTSILTFDLATGITYKNGWNPARLSAKTSEYARTIIYPNALNLRESYLVLNVEDAGEYPYNTITIKGNATGVWRGLTPATNFHIIYGQLIRQQVNGVNVKFFDNSGTNAFADADTIRDGICEVCHTLTAHYKSGGTGSTTHTLLDLVTPKPTDGTNCIDCHRHEVGFAHKLDGTGAVCKECHNSNSHSEHLDLNVKCSGCHNLDDMRNPDHSIKVPDNTVVCLKCHQDGRGGPPNDTTYAENWSNPAYEMDCDGCHNGRPDTFNSLGNVLWNSPDEDFGEMQTFGHKRLVGEAGIRQYPCWYCHQSTINGYTDQFNPDDNIDTRWNNWSMTEYHANGEINVNIAPKWNIDGSPDPAFKPASKNCENTYCHSDGTGRTTDFRAYPWNDNTAKRDCNSCHGHPPEMDCFVIDAAHPELSCHPSEPDKAWTEENMWLSAMPMYKNTGPGTDRANSHVRHMNTGFSCDDCHNNTVGGACLDCHKTGVPSSGEMVNDEESHVSGFYHVNKTKNVNFKNGGTYYRTKIGEHKAKSCAGTACHVGGQDPVWGGSVINDVTCLECHSTPSTDFDDFGEFNGSRARISLLDWVESGHGRREFDENGDPNLYVGSDNPPAKFPTNGCWYCHDNNVLHGKDDNPFRLRRHEHFTLRFERECAYCHMLGNDNECLTCHNDQYDESMAPQLADIPADADLVINDPPYKISRPNHALYVNGQTSCSDSVNGNCHEANSTRHKVEMPAEINNAEEIADISNQYVMMGVCLKCHDDDSGGQCQTCHEGDNYITGFKPDMPGFGFIQPEIAKASSFHFGYKHYQAYLGSINIIENAVNSGVTDEPPFINNKFRDLDSGWGIDTWKDNHFVVITNGPNVDEKRRIKSNTADSIIVYTPFPDPVGLNTTYQIQDVAQVIIDTGTVDSSPEMNDSLKEDDKNWVANAWIKQYDDYFVYFKNGLNKDLKRKIKSHTNNTITLAEGFPNNIIAGDQYKIVNPVWKGGKFCWDCHDPHGDSNPYYSEGVNDPKDKFNAFMVQTWVATESDGIHGKPIPSLRKRVEFLDNEVGSNYAKHDPPNGICNVCHDDSLGKTQYYNKSGGSNHNPGKRCTQCHEHRFTDSHAGKDKNGEKNTCHTCHSSKPVPRHTAFGLPRDCTKCHDGTIKTRMNIMGQFRSNSHHVQREDESIRNTDCYQCHWEATEFGLINLEHHTGYNYVTHETVVNDPVDLVIWQEGDSPTVGERPTEYITTPGLETVTTFRATNLKINDPDPAVVLQAERKEITKITPHCISCHSEQNSENDEVFIDDCKTPSQYAWDGYSIDEKYSEKGTAKWGKYAYLPNAAKKDLVKAFSAHGNAVNNAGGFNAIDGVDFNIDNSRPGAYDVQCFDCHNSHGSNVIGTTSSYTSLKGLNNGANLKETTQNKGGYQTTYAASAWDDEASVRFYNAGAGQCFDCHESQLANIENENGDIPPWGYGTTFGALAPIVGYKDNNRFEGSYPGKLNSGTAISRNQASTYLADSNVSFAYRDAKRTLGGHMNASHNNPLSSNFNPADPSANDIPTLGRINGLCTPCHDPHGVSPTLGDNMKYAVPLLKGTWLTSPYREDHPAPDPYGPRFYKPKNTGDPTYKTWGYPAPYYSQHFDVYRRGFVPDDDGIPENRYNLDRTLFNDPTNATQIKEDDSQFAGLCLRCHPKENLTNPAVEEDIYNTDEFRSVERIHEAVKGWGGNMNEHYFSCSKCHQPHASGLPRLMQTNCLDFQHRGGIQTGGLPQFTKGYTGGRDTMRSYGFPVAALFGNNQSHYYALKCHAEADIYQNPGIEEPKSDDWDYDSPPKNFREKQLWNNVTIWSSP